MAAAERDRRLWPLYAAGFTTAFGAHGIAANLGDPGRGGASSLLYLGLLLALYDGAEVVLKPVFGSLADRIGARPVLLGGLVGFALASGAFALVDDSGWIWAARLAQGAAASAFSPGAIVALGGLGALFAVMAALAAVVAVWGFGAVPVVPPLPRARQTLLDLARRVTDRAFLHPTTALAAATAAISVGVGFLPVSGAAAGLGPVVSGAAVSLLALCAAIVQPRAGRALDDRRMTAPAGIAAGLAITAAGLAAAMLPGIAG